MKKRFNFGRLSALALALTLITTCLMGGTLAKYTSKVEGLGTATVAKWKVDFKKGNAEFTNNMSFTLTDTSLDVKTDTIAPGSKGSIPLTIDASGSETAVKVSYTINTTSLNSLPIKFYSDVDCTQELTTLTDSKEYSAATADKKWETTIYWKWIASAETEEDKIDDADTAAGKSTTNTTGTITLSLKAEQINKVTTTP